MPRLIPSAPTSGIHPPPYPEINCPTFETEDRHLLLFQVWIKILDHTFINEVKLEMDDDTSDSISQAAFQKPTLPHQALLT
jgi:hypothetical protein